MKKMRKKKWAAISLNENHITTLGVHLRNFVYYVVASRANSAHCDRHTDSFLCHIAWAQLTLLWKDIESSGIGPLILNLLGAYDLESDTGGNFASRHSTAHPRGFRERLWRPVGQELVGGLNFLAGRIKRLLLSAARQMRVVCDIGSTHVQVPYCIAMTGTYRMTPRFAEERVILRDGHALQSSSLLRIY